MPALDGVLLFKKNMRSRGVAQAVEHVPSSVKP
jgi:hypothetical protein